MTMRRTVTIGNRGRIVIPAAIRAAAGIEPGTRVSVVLEEGRIILEIASAKMVDLARGMFKGGPSLSAALKQQRQNERQ